MASQTLLTYLKNVLKLETDLYICEKVIEKHDELIEQCKRNRRAVPGKFTKPVKPEKKTVKLDDEVPSKPRKKAVKYQGWWKDFCYIERVETPFKVFKVITRLICIVAGLAATFIPLIISIISYINGQEYDPNVEMFFGGLALTIFLSIFSPRIIIALINCIYRIFIYPSRYRRWKKESDIIHQKNESKYQWDCACAKSKYKQDIAAYEQAMDEYNRQCNELIEIENQREAALVASKNEYCDKYRDILNVLHELYSTNIIHPDYRSLVPVSMFVNYIEKDRCPALGGVNGAYNKYEEELRANLIINQLDEINQSLGTIQNSMGTLYRAIQGANENIRLLSAEVKNNQNALEESMRRSDESRHWDAQLIADQTAALASIEEEKLFEIRRIGNALQS